MVYPVNNILFRIGTRGRNSSEADMRTVADMETFGISFDSGVTTWTPLDSTGWQRRLMTTKSVSISLRGKRNYGDPGNDYAASLAYQNGNDAATVLHVVFPDGARLTMNCIINVRASDGGSAADVGALEFEALSDGEPTYEK